MNVVVLLQCQNIVGLLRGPNHICELFVKGYRRHQSHQGITTVLMLPEKQ